MTVEVIGTNLVITIPMNPKPVASSSGKTKLVASGQAKTTIMIEGKPLVVGVNAYIK